MLLQCVAKLRTLKLASILPAQFSALKTQNNSHVYREEEEEEEEEEEGEGEEEAAAWAWSSAATASSLPHLPWRV